MYHYDPLREWASRDSKVTKALLSRLAFEERSLYRHQLPEPEPDSEAAKDADPKDAWFGYTRLEMTLKYIADSITSFRNMYISANQEKNSKPPEFVGYPSPYNESGKPKPNFSKDEVMSAMEKQAFAMEAAAGVIDWGTLFTEEEEQSPGDPYAPPGTDVE